MKTIIHVPHSGLYIPKSISFTATQAEIEKELLLMTDRYTNELFYSDNATMMVFPYSRLYCDVERFRDEEKEAMEKYGMGYAYTKLHNGKSLRQINNRETVLYHYDLWHEMLNDNTKRALEEFGECLIIDGHSFNPEKLPHEEDESERPDICIGSDEYHTPNKLVCDAIEYFTYHNFNVKVNSPFSGTIVPSNYYMKNKHVKSIMIEINRKLYMNKDGSKKEQFNEIQDLISEFINMVC